MECELHESIRIECKLHENIRIQISEHCSVDFKSFEEFQAQLEKNLKHIERQTKFPICL